ncbi:MAG: Do family serine endopeptidase [candidate division KSB1 bacterium]
MAKRKTYTLLAVTLGFGITLGLILASNFELPKRGHAEMTVPVKLAGEALPKESAPETSDLVATSKAYVQVAKMIMPTVVGVTSESVVRMRSPISEFFSEDWWHGRSRGRRRGEGEYRQEGLGSGVIVSPEGYIVTNNHVIREAEKIAVFVDRKKYTAKVIGSDPETDLAVIKIDEKNLPSAKFGNSDQLEVGELVLAVGNPFFLQLAHSVTAGIVSGKGRTSVGVGDINYEDFIQTDAAINPGNSGGALVNLKGELVGINTAIVSNGWGGGNVGIGFAIPINLARQIVEQLIASGNVVRGWMGVSITSADQETVEEQKLPSLDGALIDRVTSGSPAEQAGLKKGDFIVELEGTHIRDHNQLMNMIAAFKPGTNITLKLFRAEAEKLVRVKLGERPATLAESEPSEADELDTNFFLGMMLEDLTEELKEEYEIAASSGVVVTGVEAGSQARKEGIRPGDVIHEMNRKNVTSILEVKRLLEQNKPGDLVLLRIFRRNGNFFVALKVEKD